VEGDAVKTLWAVRSGADESHLLDVKIFNSLKCAQEFADSLPERPTGGARPYIIDRLHFESGNKGRWGTR
jgi:hypothetical protein